jgi:ribosomal protein S18 acetylase RimI-like enzyme
VWHEVWPEEEYFYLYELFVAKRFRRKGIGSELVRLSLRKAMDLGYNGVKVQPKPLDDDITQEQLVSWYENLGFTRMPDHPEFFVRKVQARQRGPVV